MSKDEMTVIELADHYGIVWGTIPAIDKPVMANGFVQGVAIGEIRGQAHRQKEIDEAYERGAQSTGRYKKGAEDAMSWWAMRWTQLLCEVSISRVTAGTEEIVEQLKYEMGLKAKEVLGNNAAAARVMEDE